MTTYRAETLAGAPERVFVHRGERYASARWLPLVGAVLAVHFLPTAAVVGAAVVCAGAEVVVALRSRTTDLAPVAGAAELLVLVSLFAGRGAATFAAVWIVGQSL